MSEETDILNFRRLDDRITLSSQPTQASSQTQVDPNKRSEVHILVDDRAIRNLIE